MVASDRPGASAPSKTVRIFLELPGRDAFQVEPRQQLLDVPGAAQVGRQHRRGETDAIALIVCAAVAHPGRRTSIGPIPVGSDRCGAWPWRTTRRRPSSST